MRESPSEPFRYLRIPADERGGFEGFVRLRAALAEPALREQAARRYAVAAVSAERPELVEQLTASASRALALFAGMDDKGGAGVSRGGGLQAVSEFIEANVSEGERERAGEVLVRVLSGALFELTQLDRKNAGLAPLALTEKTQQFMTRAVVALSDAQLYPAPMAFELADFTQVQASVFQVARAPGKTVVYLGCALLIIGIFAMLYIRERRVWVWLSARSGRAHATMALSTNRKTMDGDREFDRLKEKLIGVRP